MSLKDLLFEQDPGREPPKRTPVPRYVPSPAVEATQRTVSSDSSTYDRLRGKTDFQSTDVGAALGKYSDPLAGVITDEKLRCKTAAKLAEKEGITKEKILATFDGLKVALEAEKNKFNSASGQQDDTVAAKTARALELSAQLSGIQEEIARIGIEISEINNRINNARAEFNAAVSRRTAELEKEKAHYADLLQ